MLGAHAHRASWRCNAACAAQDQQCRRHLCQYEELKFIVQDVMVDGVFPSLGAGAGAVVVGAEVVGAEEEEEAEAVAEEAAREDPR